jgi:hypothetical protein
MTTEDDQARDTAKGLAELAGLRPDALTVENIANSQRFRAQAAAALRSLDLQEFEPATVFRPSPAWEGE